MSFVLLPGNVATMRYDLAVVLAEDDREAGQVIGVSSAFVLLFGLVSGMAVLSRGLWLPLFPPLLSVGAEIWAVPALIMVVGLGLVTRAFCTRIGAFHFNSLSLVFLAAGTNGFQILAPRLQIEGVQGLILGSLFGWSASLLILMMAFLTRANRKLWLGVGSLNYLPVLRRYRNFPRYSVPYSFVGTLRIEGIKLLLGMYGNASLVGDIAFAQRLMNFPVTVFCGGIRPVLFQKATRAVRLVDVEPFVTRLLVMLVLCLTPAMVAFQFLAPEVFQVLGGGGWNNSVPFARILLVPSFLLLLTGWLDRLLDVTGRQDLALKYEVGFSLFSLLLFWVGLAPCGNTLLAVGLQSAASLVYYFVLAWVIYRVAGFPATQLARPGLLFLGMTAMMLVVVVPSQGLLGLLGSQVAGLAVTYGLFSVQAWRLVVKRH